MTGPKTWHCLYCPGRIRPMRVNRNPRIGGASQMATVGYCCDKCGLQYAHTRGLIGVTEEGKTSALDAVFNKVHEEIERDKAKPASE